MRRPRFGLLPTLGGIAVVSCVAAAVIGPQLQSPRPPVMNLTMRLQPPAWLGGKGEFVLGSDQLGREVVWRVLEGLRLSLFIGLVSVTLAALLGMMVGMISGYAGGLLDAALMRLADIQLSFPFLVLAIAVVAVLGHSIVELVIILVLWGWSIFARVTRGEVLALRGREFILASQVLGASVSRIAVRHLLPNLLPRLTVVWTYMLVQMVVAEGSLSFLGLGVEEPAASLATILNDGRVHLSTAWWIATFPGLVVMILIMGVNLLGDGLADAFNPRSRLARARVL